MLAVISTLRATAYTLISLGVMLLFQLAVIGELPVTVLLLPFIFIPFIAFLIGMSWFLAALGAFTRDAGYLMITIVPLFMFATPIFYLPSMVPAPYDFWMYGNALVCFVEILRDLVLGGRLPNMILYGWTLFISLFSFYFGYWFFDRYRNVIVDVL
jgi:lipopolysaccharide transport system permease protein